jgi:hypothetical protein
MTRAHLRRLQKLEEKRAEENDGIVTRIVWERPAGKCIRPGVYLNPEPDREEQELQLSLDFAGPTEFPEDCLEDDCPDDCSEHDC